MKKRKILTERMVVAELHAEKNRGRIRVDANLLRAIGRGNKCQAYEILSEADIIRNGLERTSQISIH